MRLREFISFHLLSSRCRCAVIYRFISLLVTLFNRDKRLAARYITYVVIIMFILPFGAVAPNLPVADQLKREDKHMLNPYQVFTCKQR